MPFRPRPRGHAPAEIRAGNHTAWLSDVALVPRGLVNDRRQLPSRLSCRTQRDAIPIRQFWTRRPVVLLLTGHRDRLSALDRIPARFLAPCLETKE